MDFSPPAPLKSPVIVGRLSNATSHRFVAELSSYGIPLHIMDCAIRLRAYDIAEMTKSSNLPILHQILVQRAFTPYQLLDFITQLVNEGEAPEIRSRLYLFLAPSKQFFDGDVKLEERRFLLKRLVEKFARIQQSGLAFLISESIKKADPEYQFYIENLSNTLKVTPQEIKPPEEIDGTYIRTLFA